MGIASFPPAASGPTAAEIAAAVNAPSLASIATAIQQNSGNAVTANWQTAGYVQANSTTGIYTFSNLGGYRFLRLVYSDLGNSTASTLFLRINGDSSSVYDYRMTWHRANQSTTGGYVYRAANAVQLILGEVGSGGAHGMLDFAGSNSSGKRKDITGSASFRDQGANMDMQSIGWQAMYNSTNVISSITIYNNAGVFSSGNIYVLGAN